MSRFERVTEIPDPQGGRNFIREGDDIKVLAGPGNKRSYAARFLYGEINADGVLVHVVVHGQKYPGRATLTHTYAPERIGRLAQTRKGKKVSRLRDGDDET